jgi:hypothetical protein
MDDFINIGSGGIRASLTRLHGEQGIAVSRLVLSMEWTPARTDALAGAGVLIEGHLGVGYNQGGSRVIGPVQSLHPIVFPRPDQHHGMSQAHVDIVADIARVQLDALEHERDGGPLTLHLHLHGHVLRPQPEEFGPNDPASFWSDTRYDVKPADWVEVLEHWQYAQGFLIQVPGYAGIDSAVMRLAKRELDSATHAILDGRYREAVAACRDGLEAVYGSTDGSLHAELEYSVKNTREADKDARFWLIRQALWVLTHAAKHNDGVTQPIEWTRRDAVAAVAVLAALIQQAPGG